MKILKLVLWLVVSFAVGKLLNLLFAPAEVLYSSLLFIVPFIIMGFQQELETTQRATGIFGKKVKVQSRQTKIAAFWGIPIGTPREVSVNEEWFPDVTSQQALEFTGKVTETLIESAIKGAFNAARSNRTIQGTR